MSVTRTMRRKSWLASTLVAAGLGLSLTFSGAQAEPIKEKVDLTHTSIHFLGWHGGFSQVTYSFRKINMVELEFDKDDVSKSRVKAVVDTSSLDSNHYYRDNFTRSETFLNTKKFPTATFESTKIWKTGANTGKMTGNLTMLGVTKPVTFDVTYNKGGPHRSGKFAIDGFKARGVIKRSDWGMKAFIPWIGDEVEIILHIEGHRAVAK